MEEEYKNWLNEAICKGITLSNKDTFSQETHKSLVMKIHSLRWLENQEMSGLEQSLRVLVSIFMFVLKECLGSEWTRDHSLFSCSLFSFLFLYEMANGEVCLSIVYVLWMDRKNSVSIQMLVCCWPNTFEAMVQSPIFWKSVCFSSTSIKWNWVMLWLCNKQVIIYNA